MALKISASGIRKIIPPGTAPTEVLDFQLIDASVGDKKKIRVTYGLVGDEAPKDFDDSDDDGNPFILSVEGDSGAVYIKLTCRQASQADTFLNVASKLGNIWLIPGEIEEDGREVVIDSDENLKDNPAKGKDCEVYFKLGTYSTTQSGVDVTNIAYGPISVVVSPPRCIIDSGVPFFAQFVAVPLEEQPGDPDA